LLSFNEFETEVKSRIIERRVGDECGKVFICFVSFVTVERSLIDGNE
jgi:hypothetical protein